MTKRFSLNLSDHLSGKHEMTVNHRSMDSDGCIHLQMKIILKRDPLPPPIVKKREQLI